MLDIESIHKRACEEEVDFYKDPVTGQDVWTTHGLLKRRRCCGSGCRHCPYSQNSKLPNQPIFHQFNPHSTPDVDLLWFSGGKDSFLSLHCLLEEDLRSPLLISTIHDSSGMVGFQGYEYGHLVEQAKHMKVDIILVPIDDYINSINKTYEQIKKMGKNVKRLVFGDLHLEGVRKWREANIKLYHNGNQIPYYYPLWKVPYQQLVSKLESIRGIEVIVSSSELPEIQVGTKFDRHFINNLPPHIDAFGENGEFHTKVVFV
eukprot:TRINITY_DN30292_c0_g1_i1.p1 TRINITY_DN30292_c0_g1~~TRINITY_DN30292_c0_g1_i1.p1  ORF type:complete len:260 (+),score=22.01 TRINITY_DN30292_c0_g1_i1:108-887(+)